MREIRLNQAKTNSKKEAAPTKNPPTAKPQPSPKIDNTKKTPPTIQNPSQINSQQNIVQMKDFVVRRNIFKCRFNNHTLQNINARISILNKNCNIVQTTISAGYCANCKTFFIMESTYQHLKRQGTLLCRICDEKSYISSDSSENMWSLAHESKLMQYGYTVSQSSELTSVRRRKILELLIDNKIMTKSDIIGYLDFFIKQRKSQEKFAVAIEKWEDDRDYISKYNASNDETYGVNRIYRRH